MNLIRFSSAALAMTMVFSFSPVFAADESSSTSDIFLVPWVMNEPEDKYYGYALSLKDEEVLNIVKNEGEVKKIIENAGFDIPAGAEIILLGAGDYYAIDKSNRLPVDADTLIELSIYALPMKEYFNVKEGETIYALHLKHDGSWEVVEGVIKDDILTLTLDGLSPIAFYKIMEDGKVIELTKEEAEQEAANPGSVVSVKQMRAVRRSPNTGI